MECYLVSYKEWLIDCGGVAGLVSIHFRCTMLVAVWLVNLRGKQNLEYSIQILYSWALDGIMRIKEEVA